jgi:hypothetical protein
MALSAISFMDNVKDVQHDNAPRFLLLEGQPLGLIKSFCHLNLEVPVIIISTGISGLQQLLGHQVLNSRASFVVDVKDIYQL